MSERQVNEGVEISGGTINVGAMAVGREARISHTTAEVTVDATAPATGPGSGSATGPGSGAASGPADPGDDAAAGEGDPTGGDGSADARVQVLLAELAERIEADGADLPNAQEALRLVRELQGALQQPQPGPEPVRHLLARLVESLKSVGELAVVATTVSDAVRHILGLR